MWAHINSNQIWIQTLKVAYKCLGPKCQNHNKNGGQNTLKLELPSRTGWTGSQLAQLFEKKYENLPKYFSENKESKKINGTQFWARMRENRMKQCKAFIKQGCHQATCWTGSQLVHLIEKKFETLPEYFSENKESTKTNDTQFRARMRENRPKQCDVFHKRPNPSHPKCIFCLKFAN